MNVILDPLGTSRDHHSMRSIVDSTVGCNLSTGDLGCLANHGVVVEVNQAICISMNTITPDSAPPVS